MCGRRGVAAPWRVRPACFMNCNYCHRLWHCRSVGHKKWRNFETKCSSEESEQRRLTWAQRLTFTQREAQWEAVYPENLLCRSVTCHVFWGSFMWLHCLYPVSDIQTEVLWHWERQIVEDSTGVDVASGRKTAEKSSKSLHVWFFSSSTVPCMMYTITRGPSKLVTQRRTGQTLDSYSQHTHRPDIDVVSKVTDLLIYFLRMWTLF